MRRKRGILKEDQKGFEAKLIILKKIKQQIKNMSILIDLQEQIVVHTPERIKTLLKSIFRGKEYICKNIQDTGRELVFHIQSSRSTYRLSTIWKFVFSGPVFCLHIMFYNKQQNDYIRAHGTRMKLQLSILVNSINKKVLPSFAYFVDCDTGLLKISSYEAWPVFYTVSQKKQNIELLIKNFFIQINRYDDLLKFIEPADFNSNQITSKQKKTHEKVNRFRTVLKNTRNWRKQIQGCLGEIIKLQELKNKSKEIEEQLKQVRSLYLKNVCNFQKSIHGLEDVNWIDLDNEFFLQKKEVIKNQIGVTHFNQNQTDNSMMKANKNNTTGRKNNQKYSQQILSGLLNIQPGNQQKLLSQEGAHAHIYKNTFKYTYLSTLHNQTAKLMQVGITVRGQLLYKACNKNSQGAINSFNNQIRTLDYMRSKDSPFIGKYFMELKRNMDQNDKIYMLQYRENVFTLLQRCNAYSIKTRLELAYRIAKGLCFLYSMEIVHRDFKPQNIVVDNNLIPKIIDFGSSICHYMKNKYQPHDQRLLTTQGYNIQYYTIPPSQLLVREKFNKREYDQHPLFDVYGFGRTLSYIFFGSIVPPLPNGYLSSPVFDIMDHIIFLINMCLKVDPDDRPGFGELTAFLGALRQMIKEGNFQEEMIPEYDDDSLDA